VSLCLCGESKLPPDEVHVWRTSLDLPQEAFAPLSELLSPEEAERAARFRFERDRRRFVVAQGTLRRLLARYTGQAPAELLFERGPWGKPSLVSPEGGAASVRFNLSHSGELALYAVTRAREVGVDVERVRPDTAIERLASRFFSPVEAAELLSLPEPSRRRAFFDCWTRKEAVMKAVGRGLALGLDQFDVTLRPGEPPRLRRTAWDPADATRWALHVIEVPDGYAGALAVEGGCASLVVREIER
jgi:4'-phosphopantetheinyl transferase